MSTPDEMPWDPILGASVEAEFKPLLGGKQCFAGAVV
jgi:hypothetical protein